MATLLPNDRVTKAQLRGYRVFIFSHDHPRPPHVHFGTRKRYSSLDIVALECVDPDGFSRSELTGQRDLLAMFAEEVLWSWHEHWNRQNREQ